MKKEQIEKAYYKKRQNLEILLLNEKFQEDIHNLRKKWNIPKDGLKTDQEFRKWEKWMAKESMAFLKRELNPNKAKETKDTSQIQKMLPKNAFEADLDNLLSKYKQSPKSKKIMRFYLKGNDIEEAQLPSGVLVNLNFDKDEKRLKGISLIIDHDTTLEDVKAMWGIVKIWQKDLPYRIQDKFQPRPNLKIDKIIVGLRKKKLSFKQIAEYLQKTYYLEVSHDDVRKRYSRLIKKSDIN